MTATSDRDHAVDPAVDPVVLVVSATAAEARTAALERVLREMTDEYETFREGHGWLRDCQVTRTARAALSPLLSQVGRNAAEARDDLGHIAHSVFLKIFFVAMDRVAGMMGDTVLFSP